MPPVSSPESAISYSTPPYWPLHGGAHRGDHTTAAPPPLPGWYNDPSGARGQRYFDGANWTEHRAATLSLEQRSELLEEAIFNHYRGLVSSHAHPLRPFS